MSPAVAARPLPGIPEVRPGDDLAALIGAARGAGGFAPGEVLVVAHKVVSKAEGRVIALDTVTPSEQALRLAARLGKDDPRHVEVVLRETAEVVRAEHGVLISRTHHGFVCANAGVDASNAADPDHLILLPTEPDASARRLRARSSPATPPSSSPTPSAAPGATASATSRSASPACARSRTGAASRTPTAAS